MAMLLNMRCKSKLMVFIQHKTENIRILFTITITSKIDGYLISRIFNIF